LITQDKKFNVLITQELMNEQQMEQQRPLGETDATVKPSQENTVI